jgi:sulfur-oxidizing protein SoxA
MNTRALLAAAVAATLAAPALQASPEEDLKAFRAYFADRFPEVPFEDFANGVYAIDKGAREQWEALEDFPPYELAIEEGERLFNEPFANGKTYADCFDNGGEGIRQNYPYWDAETGQVKTLEQEINECREANGEKPLKWKKGAIAAISAYMAYSSRGNKMNVVIPEDDERALAAYERGKRHFYSKRGQLSFACADCHVYNSGMQLRTDILSPALGHVTHFPVYRSKWGELGTLHRRYGGCNKQVRAKPFPAQGEEYRDLEYFHSYMSNDLPVNGPGSRK